MGQIPAIQAEGLVKTFGPTRALDGLDLAVPAGGILGMLGPNGAGKTTAVRVFATLLRPDAGQARILGADVVTQAGQVQPAAHATGVGLDRAPGGAGQVEPGQQLVGPAAGLPPGEPAQLADHDQIGPAGQVVVQRRVLAGQRDELADLHRVGDDVVAADPGVPGVGLQQGGQHPHGGGLARPVRAEQGEHAAPLRRDVHPGQRLGVPEALGQSLGLDHVAHPCPAVVGRRDHGRARR